MGRIMNKKVEELLNASKVNDFLKNAKASEMSRLSEILGKKEDKEECCEGGKTILWVLAVIGAIAAVAAIAYGVYRYFTPDYLEDFEDDFEDDFDDEFDDDFFEDEDENEADDSETDQ